MPRPIIITKKEIWRRRQTAYAHNLEIHNHIMTRLDRTDILLAMQHIQPTLNIFGEMDKERHRGDIFAIINSTRINDPDLINPWLWSEEGWKEYQEAFNALEEPYTDYRMTYNKELDRIEYEPTGYG